MNDADADRPDDAAQPSIESGRESAIGSLADHAVSGGLTLDEYAERATAIERAASSDELGARVARLPEGTAGVPPARGARWLLAVLGGTEQRGRWRLSSHLRIVAVFGGAKVDLGAAQPEAAESVITVVAVFGGAEISAPPGVSIQLSGFSLLGGKSDQRTAGPPLPGSPLVRIRVFSVFGGVTVKDRL